MGMTVAEIVTAILADPYDVDLRLVAADALDEAGDPRGTLLRCAVALRTAPQEEPPSKREWAALSPYAGLANGQTQAPHGPGRLIGIEVFRRFVLRASAFERYTTSYIPTAQIEFAKVFKYAFSAQEVYDHREELAPVLAMIRPAAEMALIHRLAHYELHACMLVPSANIQTYHFAPALAARMGVAADDADMQLGARQACYFMQYRKQARRPDLFRALLGTSYGALLDEMATLGGGRMGRWKNAVDALRHDLFSSFNDDVRAGAIKQVTAHVMPDAAGVWRAFRTNAAAHAAHAAFCEVDQTRKHQEWIVRRLNKAASGS